MHEKKYRLLMLTTSMQYGGAETHILELARYLNLDGCEIKVMSNADNQDLFTQEIEKAGVEHIYAPFDSRSVFAMRKSAKILKKVLKEFKPDIVHAHARIPAFVAARICKRVKTPLVTTMHGTFLNTPLLRLLTNWGDYSLYVSGDIIAYWSIELTKAYKIKPGYMTQTVNGINTDLFNPAASGSDIREEFNIKDNEKIILTISRLDAKSSYSAVKLCEIAEYIYNNDKDTRIIIVGDGEIFEDIRAKALEINKKLGFDYIIMTGRRADTYKFYSECSVFVCISRSVLEALACGKPVILCGDYGWAGRFTRENAERCEATNFTLRGFGYPENINQELLDEIFYCMNEDNKKEISADCEYGVSLINSKYSVKKMADDAYSVYRKAELKYKKYDFVLSGYYGYNNIGDDALLFSLLSNILKLKDNLKICVLTRNPRKIQKNLDNYFPNIIAKPRFNLLRVPIAIKKSRALVFGGGTLLQDITSSRSLSYYLWLIKLACKYKKKAILYANGIGPLYNKKNQAKVRNIVKYIDLATIRDEDSYKDLIDLGMDKSKVYCTADEAVTIRDYHNYNENETRDLKEYIKNKYIVVSVRKWQGLGNEFFEKFSAAVNNICREYNFTPVYIVMRPEEDRAISQRMADTHGQAYVANTSGDIDEILAIIKSAEAVISMRLHALIFASAFNVPMIGVSYDPKVKSFLELIYEDNNYAVELDEFSENIIIEKFKLLISNHEAIADEISVRAQNLREQAEQNARLFLEEMER